MFVTRCPVLTVNLDNPRLEKSWNFPCISYLFVSFFAELLGKGKRHCPIVVHFKIRIVTFDKFLPVVSYN